jgi:hypothetical protein
MEATRAVQDTSEIARIERRRLLEAENTLICRWTRRFHQVVDQCIAAATIGMEESIRRIKPGSGKRHPHLTLQDGIGIVKDCVGGFHSMACHRLSRHQRAAARTIPCSSALLRSCKLLLLFSSNEKFEQLSTGYQAAVNRVSLTQARNMATY